MLKVCGTTRPRIGFGEGKLIQDPKNELNEYRTPEAREGFARAQKNCAREFPNPHNFTYVGDWTGAGEKDRSGYRKFVTVAVRDKADETKKLLNNRLPNTPEEVEKWFMRSIYRLQGLKVPNAYQKQPQTKVSIPHEPMAEIKRGSVGRAFSRLAAALRLTRR